MTTMQQTPTRRGAAAPPRFTFNWNQFVSEHITRSWWLMLWLAILTFVTARYTLNRLAAEPVSTTIVLIAWTVTVILTVFNEGRRRHTSVTLWLKNNLYSSITNIQITLLMVLAIIAAIIGLYHYMIVSASFTTIPATDIRAEVSSVTDDTYCFNIGRIDPETGSSVLRDASETCYPARSFAPELSEVDITAVSLGAEQADFCFDRVPNDPENGVACFSTVAGQPDLFAVTYVYSGANWGAVIANLTNLMVFRFNRGELWRVWASVIMLVVLAVPSIIVYRDSFKNKTVRRILTYIWLASPILLYVFLRGAPGSGNSFTNDLVANLTPIVVAAVLWAASRYVNRTYPQQKGEAEWLRMGRLLLNIAMSVAVAWALFAGLRLIMLLLGALRIGGEQVFSPLAPDRDWGGFLLTLIITAFAIVVSFPLGLILALGRRSQIPGIPIWVTYPTAAVITVWGLVASTPALVDQARNTFELIVAYWPLAVPLIVFAFQRVWNGNVVAAFSTLYIEFVRGIPLITVLFLTIILFPIFLPPNVEILNVWRVMWGFTLFSAAYLAENVRGGLQAIPNGQYEAADSLGLSTFNKYRLIILPQALRIVIPAITNQFIGLFKDTTLVAIVGLLDILGVANAISAQPQWLGVRREAYIFIALMYYIICALIAGYSARLEKRAGLGER